MEIKRGPGADGVDINIGLDNDWINSMRGQTIKTLAEALKGGAAGAGGLAAEIGSLRAEDVHAHEYLWL